MEEKKHIHFGKKLKQLRLEKGISQEDLAEKLGVGSNSYISDAERGRFLPADDKLRLWAKVIGVSMQDIEDLKLEAEIERLGIDDPGFTMMFKEVPNMTREEKQSVLRAFQAMMKARAAKG